MRWLIGLVLACLIGAIGLIAVGTDREAVVAAPTPRADAAHAAPARNGGGWQPPSGLTQIPLWPGGAPDMADLRLPPETTDTTTNPQRFEGRPVTGVHNVSSPTMTVFPARRPGNGAAMVVFPGGGFQVLAIDLEGTEACDWMTAKGIVCVLVKYRVPKTDTYGDWDCHCQITPKVLRALQDAQRAIRMTRAKAHELRIDPDKIGVIGFSAGGYLVAQTSNIFVPTYTPVDAIDRVSSRPDFAIAAYPGHLCRDNGKTFDPTLHVTKRTPPTFLVQTWDDGTDPICDSTMYARALDAAGVPAEVHLFAKGDHAFALRRTGHPVDMWPSLVERWLHEIAILSRAPR